MVDSIVVPFSLFVEDEHLFCLPVSIDHVKVEHLILLEEWVVTSSAPIVMSSHWNHMVDWQSDRLKSVESETFKLQELSLWIE